MFAAKAIILATGGVGRAYKVTSNSWEGTGDGHALAYRAGAELIDMEFIQFHPTGMVWPPSVQGILVTEGVRGEGGILKNSEGRRFMFDDIPDNYKPQTASDAEEGWRYTQGDKSARRPPELLTRDHVARCINREVKAGRGSPHGGVFSTSPGSRKSCPNAEEHIKRKLPSMYHQFKQLADLDITKEAMEVGSDDALHHGRRPGGCRLADVDDSGAVRRGRVRVGHQRRQSPRRQLALGPDRVRQAGRRICRRLGARATASRAWTMGRVARARTMALEPFERGAQGENPYKVQRICRRPCRRSSASSASRARCEQALERLADYKARAARVGVSGSRDYHAGWHTASTCAIC